MFLTHLVSGVFSGSVEEADVDDYPLLDLRTERNREDPLSLSSDLKSL